MTPASGTIPANTMIPGSGTIPANTMMAPARGTTPAGEFSGTVESDEIPHFSESMTVTDTLPSLLSDEKIKVLKKKSCSRKNFATRLNCEIFDEETRKRSNVGGKLGKMKLNPVLIQYIRSIVFQHYPLEEGETIQKAWSNCVTAIDAGNRCLNKELRKTM